MEQQRATSSRGRGRNAAIARSSFADFRQRSPDAGQFVLALQLMALRRRRTKQLRAARLNP
jgi:hypothetical protein